MSASPAHTARWLLTQHRDRLDFQALPQAVRPASVSDACPVQADLVCRKAQDCGAPIAWNIALWNPAVQQMVGLDALIAGRVPAGSG
jgi:2-keto-4-pentenoate hydratase